MSCGVYDETVKSSALFGKGARSISSNILRERRVKRARVLCGVAFPGRLFARDQVVTFQSEACFPRAVFTMRMVLFKSPNKKIMATRDYHF